MSSRLLAAALAALVVAHWLATAVWTGGPLTPWIGDLVNYYVPFYAASFERLAQGQLPLWNPWQLTGLPWLATLQVGVFYPPHWLYALLPVHVALAANHLFHLLLIALSTSRFAREQGLSPAAAALAALLFTLQGTSQWWLILPPLLEAGAWLALGCLGVSRLARGGDASGARLLALAAGMSGLAGMPQVSVFLGYAWVSLFAVLALRGRPPLRQLGARSAGLAAALGVGAAIAAVQLLPTFLHTLEATRATAALSQTEVGYLAEDGAWFARRTLVGSRFSFGPVALALVATAALTRRRRALAGWALGLGLAAWLLALGGESWAFPVYQRLPGVGWFRDPRKLFLLAHFGAALLAAIALDVALGREERPAGAMAAPPRGTPRRALLPLCAALAVAALVAADRAWPALLSALLVAGVLALRLAGRSARLSSPLAAAALLLAACLDGFSAESQRGRVPYGAATAPPYGRDATFFARVAELAGESRVAWLPPRVFYEIKLQPRYRLRGLDDYEPLTLRRQARYFDFLLYGAETWRTGGELFFGAILRDFDLPLAEARRALAQVAGRRRLLDLAAARYYLALARPPGGDRASAFAEAAGLVELPSPDPAFRLFESPQALPRAFVTYRTREAPADPLQLLARLSRQRFDPLVASFVEGAPPLAAAPDAPARGHPAAIALDEETRVEIEAELAAPGLVVLADSFANGWRASVDGEPAPIHATNHLFRGVFAPPGRHRIRFEYRPPGLAAGAAASAVGLALLVAAGWRRTRPAPTKA